MDSLCVVRPLASAIYGRVLLVRHRTSGRYYALKVMSLPHMRAHRAVTGPYVQEDGDTELQILRKVGRSLVFKGDENKAHPNGEEHEEEAIVGEDDMANWTVSPVWSSGVGVGTETATEGEQYLLTLHQDFVDWTTNSRCLLFDYCPFGDLFTHVTTRPTGNGLPLEVARSCFLQIASAVRFLHSRNVAHRDLSLENVLLDNFRRCRLGDFGLASAAGSRCFGARVGKILYMAPEVFSRPPYRPDAAETGTCYNGLQADVWSLGVILFILVTGIPPFEHASEADARFRLMSKPSGSIRELLRAWGQENRLSQELRGLLDWMLRVDPQQRPTADQICGHEWLVATNEQIPAAKESPGEKRPSAEPEAEEDGESLEPQKMSKVNQSDKSWSWSTPSSNKRVKR